MEAILRCRDDHSLKEEVANTLNSITFEFWTDHTEPSLKDRFTNTVIRKALQ
jgi:hypothetical protein